MNQITINGKTIVSNGGSISISNGKITIDGKNVDFEDAKEINIEVHGSIDSLDVDSCNKINISGSCVSVKTHNGSVDIGGDVKSDVSTHNGNIDCGNVCGNVSTRNGNIKHKKQ